MSNSVAEIANHLDLNGIKPIQSNSFDDFNEIHKSLTFFRRTHYEQYIPTLSSEHRDFEIRLFDWLQNVSSVEEQGLLLELASRIVFLAREDISKLHEAALTGPVCQWIIDHLALKFEDVNFDSSLLNEIENHTWFTSITDSMQISEFHHANRLGGIDHRPDWKCLAEFGDVQKIASYMSSRKDAKQLSCPIKRIVILEDFVGSGSQMVTGSHPNPEGCVEFAARNFPNIPILLCPLIICPNGARIARILTQRHSNVTFAPVIEMTQEQFFSPDINVDPASFENGIVNFCKTTYPKVIGNDAAAPRPYTEWGFAKTGASIVMYTNSPANTLPLIQHQSNTWNALFPRSARIR